MSQHSIYPNPAHEKRNLEIGFLVSAIGSLIVFTVLEWMILGSIMAGFALLNLAGWSDFERRGRNVYIIIQALGRSLHWLISPVVLALMYLFAILLPGALLRLVGMNRLERRFDRCRERDTMFEEAPTSEPGDFRRQS